MRTTTIALLLMTFLGCPQPAPDDTGPADTDTDTDTDTDVDTDTDTDTDPVGVLTTCPQCVDLGAGVWRLPVFPEAGGVPWTQQYGNWIDDSTGSGGWIIGPGTMGELSQAISDPLPVLDGARMTSMEVEGNCLQVFLLQDPPETGTTGYIFGEYLAPETIDTYVLDIVVAAGVTYQAEAGAANNGGANGENCRVQRIDVIFEEAP